MQKAWAYLLYGILWVVSWPPLVLSKPLTKVIQWNLHKVIKYRQQVIRQNLSKSFPDKSGEDLLQIEKGYYRWLSQLVTETLKIIHLGPTQLQRRVILKNPEILTEYYNSKQDIIILTGHTGNWEWSPGAIYPYGYDVLGVYKPQSSAVFDRLMYLIRKKKQVFPVPMKGTIRALKEKSQTDRPRALLLIADQTPPRGDINCWIPFLNQQTGWFTGAEKLAKRFNLPVLYLKMQQIKPGYYSCEYLPLLESNELLPETELINYFVHALEQTILEQPPFWLWSHRRWKHQP